MIVFATLRFCWKQIRAVRTKNCINHRYPDVIFRKIPPVLLMIILFKKKKSAGLNSFKIHVGQLFWYQWSRKWSSQFIVYIYIRLSKNPLSIHIQSIFRVYPFWPIPPCSHMQRYCPPVISWLKNPVRDMNHKPIREIAVLFTKLSMAIPGS